MKQTENWDSNILANAKLVIALHNKDCRITVGVGSFVSLAECLLTHRIIKRRCLSLTKSQKAITKDIKMTLHHTRKDADLDPEALSESVLQKDPEEPRVEIEAESAPQTERKPGDGAGRVPMIRTAAGGGEKMGRTLMTRTAGRGRKGGSKGRDLALRLAGTGSHTLNM